MAKKSSRKTLKGLFSKSEASLDGAAERDAETEVEKKKFKLFRIKSKSKGGSGPEKAASEEQLARRSATTSGTAVLSEPDWTHKMNSGFSSLSTTLSLKNSSSPPEDESKRIRKVSLIRETEARSGSPPAAAETNGGEFKWRNRFEGVSQFKPPSEDSPLSDGSEAATCNYLDTSFSLSSHAPEQHVTSGNREGDVCTGGEGERRDEWRRSSTEWEEPAAPAEREGAPLRLKSHWQQSAYDNTLEEEDEDSECFTGVFQATLVELDSDLVALPSTPPASPDSDSLCQFDMDNLVDTLKSMGPSMRPRTTVPRPPAPVLMSSLPPIVEDTHSPASVDVPDISGAANTRGSLEHKPTESLNGLYTLPPDLGLRSTRDTRSILDLMKQEQVATRGPGSILRTPNSSVMGTSDSLLDDAQSQILNGNGLLPSSRLDNSVIFGRSVTLDQNLENKAGHRSRFRTSSLPDVPFGERLSMGAKELESGTRADPVGSRYDRFAILLNNSTSGSLNGSEDVTMRISRAPYANITSPPPSNSPTRLLSPTGSIDLHRPLASPESTLAMFGQTPAMGVGAGRVSTPILQRSFSSEASLGVQQTSLFNSIHADAPFRSQEPPPESNLPSKYRAFPDAYLTKEKDHGKLNPRPGKMYIFDRLGMCGQRFEVRSDVIDATSWELQETISIRVVRGGWVLYEKPNFKGNKIALDEGDLEITCPFSPAEHQQNGHEEGAQNQPDGQTKPESERRFIIGSIRRVVRDYSVPEISLFPEEDAEGKKVVFRDTSDDARIFGQPIKANSVIVNAGLWLVYAHPSFQGTPRVLEVGGYSNPAAWGVDQPYVGSLHPLKIGEPRVENPSEPKMVIYDKPYFSGKSRTITGNMRDFMTRTDSQQTTFMYSVGSLKVLGGIWVGYEREGFRGHQYLLEEGEYHDWRVWGGNNSELRSARVIRADLSDPLLVMFELPEDEGEGEQEENTFEVTEAIPDVELFNYRTNTRSIHVVSGAWIAYSHVDFSGNQYILEKGFYNNCADWGSQDNRICSVQPILMALGSKVLNELILYSEPDFKGECQVFDHNQEAVSEKLVTKSCRVSGGSWVIYEEKNYSGSLYVLSEGDYPNLSSMGCPSGFTICSVKTVPVTFTVPSISLFSLECLEGREITMDSEITSLVEEGFNNHVLSIRVDSGCWVICEHSNYRGRQFFLEPLEITNWLKFSSLQTVGSLFPVRQKRRVFRIKNSERGQFLSVQGGVDEMKSGRVVVSAQVEPMSDIWYYQDGLLKNKLISTMSLQVMGTIEPGAKAVLWSETRQPIQTWITQMKGLINSVTFPGMVLDVKGGKTYDKDHVVIMPESEERPSQQWVIELL
uniref:Beta/gamma crystallin domain-containing protein 1-like n=1 Tax=Takifugu rubripes TaxID=31033 RepID=A0A674NW84_TAKRU